MGDENGETELCWRNFCECERNIEKVKNACARPGNTSVPQIDDDGWVYDSRETCNNALCCAPEAGMSDNRCMCVHRGGSYTGEPLSTEEKCCSATNNGDGKCGCGEVGSTLRWGGEARDCCSGAFDKKTRKCKLQDCAGAGEAPSDERPCCRFKDSSGKFHSPSHKGRCGCFPAGAQPASEVDDISGGNSCCARRLNGSKCSLITDNDVPLLHGADASDCYYKKAKKNGKYEFCVNEEDECLPFGAKIKGSLSCCSGVELKEKGGAVCGCLAPGKKFPAKEGVRTCCAGKADFSDKDKCGHLDVGSTFDPRFNDKSICSSGKVDATGACACIHQGQVSADPSQCCSGWTDAANKCGCMEAGPALKYGAQGSDCCSGEARNEVCLCVRPGRPSASHFKGKECCAKRASGGYCGCLDAQDGIVDMGRMCCGGFFNVTSAHCQCLPSGTSVAAFVHDAACCGDLRNLDGSCSRDGIKPFKPKDLKKLGR